MKRTGQNPKLFRPHSTSSVQVQKINLDHAPTVHHVDKFYHERLASIYNACPIYGYIPKLDAGSGPLGGERAWRHFYDFVCNTRNKPSDVPFDSNKHVLEDLSEAFGLNPSASALDQETVSETDVSQY